jgi:hypothetical protein
MEAIAIIGVLFLVVLAWYLRRHKTQPRTAESNSVSLVDTSPQKQLAKLQANDIFWGVSVESHCRASSRLAGQKFPFDVAPVIPVANCDAEVCKCCFIGLPERRRRSERRSGIDRRGSLRMESSDRRDERPRRRADLDSWVTYGHL